MKIKTIYLNYNVLLYLSGELTISVFFNDFRKKKSFFLRFWIWSVNFFQLRSEKNQSKSLQNEEKIIIECKKNKKIAWAYSYLLSIKKNVLSKIEKAKLQKLSKSFK